MLLMVIFRWSLCLLSQQGSPNSYSIQQQTISFSRHQNWMAIDGTWYRCIKEGNNIDGQLGCLPSLMACITTRWSGLILNQTADRKLYKTSKVDGNWWYMVQVYKGRKWYWWSALGTSICLLSQDSHVYFFIFYFYLSIF